MKVSPSNVMRPNVPKTGWWLSERNSERSTFSRLSNSTMHLGGALLSSDVRDDEADANRLLCEAPVWRKMRAWDEVASAIVLLGWSRRSTLMAMLAKVEGVGYMYNDVLETC